MKHLRLLAHSSKFTLEFTFLFERNLLNCLPAKESKVILFRKRASFFLFFFLVSFFFLWHSRSLCQPSHAGFFFYFYPRKTFGVNKWNGWAKCLFSRSHFSPVLMAVSFLLLKLYKVFWQKRTTDVFIYDEQVQKMRSTSGYHLYSVLIFIFVSRWADVIVFFFIPIPSSTFFSHTK